MVLSRYNPDLRNFSTDVPVGTHPLVFREPPDAVDAVHACNLSGISVIETPEGIFCLIASDEQAGVIRARWNPDLSCWGDAEITCLSTLLEDPSFAAEEADLESLVRVIRQDGSDHPELIAVAGSCSVKRKKAKPDEYNFKVVLDRLGTTVRQPNKFFVALVPTVNATPVAEHEGQRIVKLPLKEFQKLFKQLAKDPHFRDYFTPEGPTIACKYGGNDYEGLLAFEVEDAPGQVDLYLGCRGPVFDQFGVIIHLRVRQSRNGKELRLVPLHRNGNKEILYRKVLVYTEGSGIRDLTYDHDGSVLVLTGPVGNGPGVSNVLKIPNFIEIVNSSQLVHRGIPASWVGMKAVHSVLTLASPGFDKPEGIDLLPPSMCGGKSLVAIAFDSPNPGGDCVLGHYELRPVAS